MLLLFVAAAAPAYSGGSHVCNANGNIIPQGAITGGALPTLTCTHTNCTLTSPENFKGFLLGVEGGFTTHDTAIAKPVNSDGQCVTHISPAEKNTVEVELLPASTVRLVRAVIVYRKNGPLHVYQAVNAHVPATNPPEQDPIVIVGGGPGGLGAARYFESLGVRYVLYEQGPAIPDSFWTEPLSTNAEEYRKFKPLGENTLLVLGEGLGGTQNVNGAVYAPGTPDDLARSLGVPQPQAKQAQDLAALWIVHDTDVDKDPDSVNVGMMWAPLNESDPDRKTLHSENTKMARRSLAYNFVPNAGTVEYNSTVSEVTDTSFDVNGVTLRHSGIILAAGALSSPQLLGKRSFDVTNHGFTVDNPCNPTASPASPDNYTFTYSENFDVETMTANYPCGPISTGIKITMVMTTPYVQKVTVGEDFGVAAGQINDPWHYMNTVDHTGMRVSGYNRVFIGDASALKKPFNCHTSMPAAAAGVLAAQALLGADLAPPPPTMDAPYAARAKLFVAGLWVLGVGIAAHILGVVFDQKKVRNIHYIFQPTGTILVTIAAVWSAIDEAPSAASLEHRIIGWITIGLLWSNMAGGVYLKIASEDSTAMKAAHRSAGYIITILLGEQAFSATVAGTGINRIANAATFTAVLGVLITVAVRKRSSKDNVSVLDKPKQLLR